MASKKKGAKPKQPKPKKKVEGIGAFTGPGFDQEAVAAAEEGSAKVRGKHARKTLGQPDDRTVGIHIDQITRARKKHEVAHKEAKRLNSLVSAAYKAAKAHGIDVDALKSAFEKARRPAGEVIAEERNTGRYLRIMGVPLGEQYNLFPEGEAQTKPLDAAAAGEHAFLNNEPIDNNPHPPGTEDHVAWAGGFNDAMKKTAGEMKKPPPPGMEDGAPLLN